MLKGIKDNKTVLHNRYVKATIMTILPLFIGGVSSAMGDWSASEDKWFYWKLSALIVLALVEIISVKKYTDWDKESYENTSSLQKSYDILNQKYDSLKQKYSELETCNNSYDMTLSELSNMFRITAQQLNNITNQVEKEGVLDLSKWNFIKGCQSICDISIAILRKIAIKDGGDGFTVNYIQKERDGTKTILEMPAYSGRLDIDVPTIQDTKKSIEDVQSYYYARLFQKKKPTIVILPDEKSILAKFFFGDTDSKPKVKYSQYIGIPVVCSKN